MWRAESTPGPIYPMTQKFREAWKRWDSCFSHETLPLSLSPHPGALHLQTGSSRQQGESCRSQNPLKTEVGTGLPSKWHCVLSSGAQLGTTGAFNFNSFFIWLWQSSPLLLFPVQEQFPMGLAFAAPSFVLRKSRCWSHQKHLRDRSDVTVHHNL